MRLLAGTSGYSYKEWKGNFYPEELPADEMLRFYAGRFPTVEINNTFYRMPAESMLARWSEETSSRFAFSLKAPRRITHDKRLRDVDPDVSEFLRRAAVLGNKLGVLLFQMPPSMKMDLSVLVEFLNAFPPRSRIALEFRHPSWQDDSVYETLRSNGAAWCVADTDDGEVPLISTADYGYLRLRRTQYDKHELRAWAERIAAQSWKSAYVYFKHEDEGLGPQFAQRFIELWGSIQGSS
jgi:uncharacterized protein YecE (DUF72 family)